MRVLDAPVPPNFAFRRRASFQTGLTPHKYIILQYFLSGIGFWGGDGALGGIGGANGDWGRGEAVNGNKYWFEGLAVTNMHNSQPRQAFSGHKHLILAVISKNWPLKAAINIVDMKMPGYTQRQTGEKSPPMGTCWLQCLDVFLWAPNVQVAASDANLSLIRIFEGSILHILSLTYLCCSLIFMDFYRCRCFA